MRLLIMYLFFATVYQSPRFDIRVDPGVRLTLGARVGLTLGARDKPTPAAALAALGMRERPAARDVLVVATGEPSRGPGGGDPSP